MAYTSSLFWKCCFNPVVIIGFPGLHLNRHHFNSFCFSNSCWSEHASFSLDPRHYGFVIFKVYMCPSLLKPVYFSLNSDTHNGVSDLPADFPSSHKHQLLKMMRRQFLRSPSLIPPAPPRHVLFLGKPTLMTHPHGVSRQTLWPPSFRNPWRNGWAFLDTASPFSFSL